MASHWIPMDPELWRIERYLGFLAERRRLLADAANGFLDELAGGTAADVEVGTPVVGEGAHLVAVTSLEDEEARAIAECREWVRSQGLADGVENYELVDEQTGEALAILDLAWPDGMQLELTQPAALLLNEPPGVAQVASAAGFRPFTSVDALQEYVETKVLAEAAA